MATCGWSLMKTSKMLKGERKNITSRYMAKLYNKGEFGLHVSILSFDTDLIRHYVVEKFLPVCVPYSKIVLLSDTTSSISGRHRSPAGGRLHLLIVGCVENFGQQYIYGTQRLFIVMLPQREGLH